MDKPASNQSEFQQLWDSWTAWYSDNGPPPVESARVLVDEGEQRYGAAEVRESVRIEVNLRS